MSERISKIKTEEGFRSSPYCCSEGKQTVGYGFNLEAIKMPEEVADHWLRIIVDDITSQLSVYNWFLSLSYDRATVIIDMAYQMGVNGVLNFKRMINALENGNYDLAAAEMLLSKYAEQTPARAKRNSDAIRTGSL